MVAAPAPRVPRGPARGAARARRPGPGTGGGGAWLPPGLSRGARAARRLGGPGQGEPGLQAAAHPHQLHGLAAGGAGEGLQREPLPRRVHARGAGAAPRPGRVPSSGKDPRPPSPRSPAPALCSGGAAASVPGPPGARLPAGRRRRRRVSWAQRLRGSSAGVPESRLGGRRLPRSSKHSGCARPGSRAGALATWRRGLGGWAEGGRRAQRRAGEGDGPPRPAGSAGSPAPGRLLSCRLQAIQMETCTHPALGRGGQLEEGGAET